MSGGNLLDLALDHIVIGARTLAEGVEYVRQRLGVRVPPGGRHLAMATHNHVMQLGSSRYLEIIAIDPNSAPPARPRWFDLDNPYLGQVLASGPRVITWVVRTPDLSLMSRSDAGLFGDPLPMQRDSLRWLITVPPDGRLPGAGFLPTIIEWQSEIPTGTMIDAGCTLRRLIIRHTNPDWLAGEVGRIGAGPLVEITACANEGSSFEAVIQTPNGIVSLR
jgi:hypothetical protein